MKELRISKQSNMVIGTKQIFKRKKNRIRRRGRSCISRRKNKNKNREELGDCGFQGRKHGHGHDTDTITTQ